MRLLTFKEFVEYCAIMEVDYKAEGYRYLEYLKQNEKEVGDVHSKDR